MAIDMFLKLAGIPGESTDPSYPNWIEVLAWSWGESNSGTTHSGGVTGGHPNLQDLSLTKYVDKASLPILGDCAAGTLIPSATFVNRKAGATPLVFLKYTLTNLIISSVSSGGSGGEDRLIENISLNFAQITWTYTYLNSLGAQISKTQGWDIVNGVPL